VTKNGIYNLDPCFYYPSTIEINNVTWPICEIEKNETNAKNGLYVLKASGSPTSANHARYDYKFGEVKIPVVADLQLSFW